MRFCPYQRRKTQKVGKESLIMQVDIYDFDKTVVPFDSALKYWGFCMVHNPWIILLLPFQFIWGMMMLTHIISVRTCKKVAFLYIRLINNEKNVKKYWDK